MTEGQNQGDSTSGASGAGGGQGDSGGTQTTSPTTTNQQHYTPNTDAIAAAARRDGETDGYAKAARELGVSIEDAKQALEDSRKRSDAEKTAEQRLAEREGELTSAKDETKTHKQRADRYEKIVKASVDSQLQVLPEDIQDLLSNFDAAGQFEWLTKHGAKYNASAPENQPTEAAEAGQTIRRAPDASRRQAIPGLEESSQSFNDLLRERGLSSGKS